MRNLTIACFSAALLTGCATSPILMGNEGCDFGDVKVSADFESARLNGCVRDEDGLIELTIKPENTPINDSAWYGFDVHGTPGETVKLALVYQDGKHRYDPKTQTRGGWENLDTDIELSQNKKRADFSVTLTGDTARIAAQPIIDLTVHKTWIDKAAALDFVDLSEIGASAENRPIYKLEEIDAPDIAKPYIVIVGRQHPPETTGAVALMHFVDEVWGDSPLAKQFRSDFNLIVIPVMNPDGVVRGHWRHNTAGIDLNRDWGPFTQPETQAAQRELNRFKSGDDSLVLFLDFHSTWRNLIYTQTDAEPSAPENFTRDYILNVKANLPDSVYSFTREANVTTDRPVAKNYIYLNYKIPAMTFEVGDNTPIENIEMAAPVFAREMMRVLLASGAQVSRPAETSP